MNITEDERRVIILRRLEHLRDRLTVAMAFFEDAAGNQSVARESLRVRLAEIADELEKACD